MRGHALEFPMPGDRFVVEADRRVVGVAVRDRGGFRFFASDKDYQELDRTLFPRVRTLTNSVTRLASRRALPRRQSYRRSRPSVQ